MKIPTLIYWRGYVEIAVRNGHMESFINELTHAGISVWDVQPSSLQSANMKILVEDFHDLRPLLRRTGCRVHVMSRRGFPFELERLKKRRFFAIGLITFFAILLLLSSLVWEVKVIGNEKISKDDVLLVAKQGGIYPLQWVYRVKHLDKLSQQLNRQLPGTAWVGVSRQGTKITIQVVESAIPEAQPLLSPRHLISRTDAVITNIYAEQGRPMVAKNNRVKKGQVLISGLLGDTENSQPVVAKGEVKGLVWHEYLIEAPLVQKRKVYTGESKDKSYLVLGNRGIQLWGYGKVSFEKYSVVIEQDPLTWRSTKLPIGWMTEHVMEMEERSEVITLEEAKRQGLDGAIRDILAKYGSDSKIISRKILHENTENGKVYMKVLFEVEEFITEELPIVYSQGE
ncbi:sporulation protein YqfD [Paenibacillus crassostreae]|uniref:Sporulation protein n=1 Tax=Paenibacillus crassostreae TaxID=1763538 RepID=A0A167C2L1_9BACL|nr:sporulation protein YqfD [Paenibacillus crassostreae]AOZ91723.1 sporulation protein YqfD [Paenibacillus crassostreae]OAB72704.1 sporulation protein [Paenibacillus crassostreae]